jgi:dipeptidyl aminopeptidase/acylaminoacyl peptidase
MKPNTFKGEYQAQFQDDVIDFDVDGGKHVLINLADQPGIVKGEAFSLDRVVYSLDVETGVRTHVHGPRANFNAWMVDRNHQVRLGVMQDKANIEIHACDPDGKNWRKLWAYTAGSKDNVEPIGFGKDPNQLYVLADNGGRRALFTVDLRDPELKRTVKLASDKGSIFGTLAYSQKTGDAIGIVNGSAQTGDTQGNFWDPGYRELLSFIDQALPNRYNPVVSTSADETRYIVRSTNANTPAEFYLGDDRANTLGLFAQSYPRLTTKDLATQRGVSIKARDGSVLSASLNTPPGATATKLPAVLLLQGGPQYTSDGRFTCTPWCRAVLWVRRCAT